jgi:hypothetical protein
MIDEYYLFYFIVLPKYYSNIMIICLIYYKINEKFFKIFYFKQLTSMLKA